MIYLRTYAVGMLSTICICSCAGLPDPTDQGSITRDPFGKEAIVVLVHVGTNAVPQGDSVEVRPDASGKVPITFTLRNGFKKDVFIWFSVENYEYGSINRALEEGGHYSVGVHMFGGNKSFEELRATGVLRGYATASNSTEREWIVEFPEKEQEMQVELSARIEYFVRGDPVRHSSAMAFLLTLKRSQNGGTTFLGSDDNPSTEIPEPGNE